MASSVSVNSETTQNDNIQMAVKKTPSVHSGKAEVFSLDIERQEADKTPAITKRAAILLFVGYVLLFFLLPTHTPPRLQFFEPFLLDFISTVTHNHYQANMIHNHQCSSWPSSVLARLMPTELCMFCATPILKNKHRKRFRITR